MVIKPGLPKFLEVRFSLIQGWFLGLKDLDLSSCPLENWENSYYRYYVFMMVHGEYKEYLVQLLVEHSFMGSSLLL